MTPRYSFYFTVRPCECPANSLGAGPRCLLPVRVRVRMPATGGWRCGAGANLSEALAQALSYGDWSGYKLV